MNPKPLTISLILTCLLVSSAFAQKTYHYSVNHFLNVRNTLDFSDFSLRLNEVDNGRVQATFIEGHEHRQTIEEHLLDENYANLEWSVVNEHEQTNYKGMRQGDTIILKGQFKGEVLDKTITIDENPFYFNPKISLRDFVLSKEDTLKFWGMRHDTLEAYLLEANRKENKTIRVNGEKYDTVRIHWAPTGNFKSFFHRNYWFRKSDGIYVKSKILGGWVKGLVGEEP